MFHRVAQLMFAVPLVPDKEKRGYWQQYTRN